MEIREKISSKYKINTKDLFENEKEFLEELEKIKNSISEISKFEGHILDSSDNLLNLLNLSNDFEKRIERLYIYAHLNNDFDLSDQKGNENLGKVLKIYDKYGELSAYIIPELLTKDYGIVKKMVEENENLKPFNRMLKSIYDKKKHFLSKEEELILNKVSESFRLPENAHSKLLDVDLTFGKIKDESNKSIELTISNYAKYIESFDRNVRKNCFKTYYKGFDSIKNTSGELLSSEVKMNNRIAEIRKYNSALEASLLENDVDPKVYDTLINAIHSNMNTIHKQWEMRKEVLKLKDMHLYDTYLPLIDGYEKNYNFDEAKELIKNALAVLGEDYSKVLNEAFENNWIDVYPTKNKRSGGYCTACYLAHPYVFLNFDGRYDEVSTIAHELGHAMHYYYAIKNNTFEDYSYSIFVAEVASQVNELLLSFYMLDNSQDTEEKLFIIDELIKRFKASVVRQTMFAEFEKYMHEEEQNGGTLTTQSLSEKYYELNQKYYGKDVVVDKEIALEWSRIPHFYYNFYVYQYSTGYIAALKIAKDIYNKKENSLNNYLKFLSLGCTIDPVASLKVAGVDLTDIKNYDDAFNEFEKEINEFNQIMKRSKI